MIKILEKEREEYIKLRDECIKKLKKENFEIKEFLKIIQKDAEKRKLELKQKGIEKFEQEQKEFEQEKKNWNKKKIF